MIKLFKFLNKLRKYSHLAVTEPHAYVYFTWKAEQFPKWVQHLVDDVIEDEFKKYFAK